MLHPKAFRKESLAAVQRYSTSLWTKRDNITTKVVYVTLCIILSQKCAIFIPLRGSLFIYLFFKNLAEFVVFRNVSAEIAGFHTYNLSLCRKWLFTAKRGEQGEKQSHHSQTTQPAESGGSELKKRLHELSSGAVRHGGAAGSPPPASHNERPNGGEWRARSERNENGNERRNRRKYEPFQAEECVSPATITTLPRFYTLSYSFL